MEYGVYYMTNGHIMTDVQVATMALSMTAFEKLLFDFKSLADLRLLRYV
jgi:hypothetical protein